MSTLDMSVLCGDWTPSVTDREVVASMPLDKELTLAVSLQPAPAKAQYIPARGTGLPFGVEDGDARTLILSAFVDEIVLFELRFWDGKLAFQAGTGETQSGPHLIYGVDHFDFQVSFSPSRGGLALVASWVKPSGGGASQTFTANISNLKLPKSRYYTLRLGAPKHFVDLSLLGWQVNATYDLAAPRPAFTTQLIKFAPADDGEPAEDSHPLVERSPSNVHAFATQPPLETLRLALQSIDSWRKVAEDALHALEGGAQ